MRRSGSLSLLAVAVLAAVSVSAPANAAGRELKTDLRGTNEAPGPGDPDGRGKAEITIDPRTGEVCFEIKVKRIGPVVGGHIHEAPAGVAGPVVVNFMLTQEDFTKGKAEGCVMAGPDFEVRDILSDPDQYYVNIHTGMYPGGAVRGQLGDDDDRDHDHHDDHHADHHGDDGH